MTAVDIRIPTPREYIPCPSCKKEMPIYENESRWCAHCNWNLEPEDDSQKVSRYTEIYRKVGKKLTQDLFNTFIQQKVSRPHFTTSKLLAYIVAGFIHSLTILMLLGMYVAFKILVPLIAAFFSLIFLGIAWVTFPKMRKFPKNVVSRAKAPALYKLLDQIADAIGTSRVSGLIINEEFNAFYTEYRLGRWKKKVIGIGVPLTERLTDEELVAVLSHETSHGANGDVARGAFIGSALDALNQWYRIFTPRHLDEGHGGGDNLFVTIGNFLGFLFGWFPWLGYYVLAHLLLRQSQEAEYIADRLAVEVCGTKPMLGLLSKFTHFTPFYTAINKAALSRGTIDLYKEMKTRYQQPQSDHDKERIQRLELRYGLSLDVTHPPTPYRKEFLKASGDFPAKVKISDEDSLAIRKELDAFKKETATKLVDEYLSSIY